MSKTAWIASTAGLALTAALATTAAQAQHWGGGYNGGYNGYYQAPHIQHAPPQVARVWVPGHWEWNGSRQVWVNGYYQVAPVYGQPYGYSRRDQDRDGIPNRYDRDRDGDGVPNRYDRNPRNPWRR